MALVLTACGGGNPAAPDSHDGVTLTVDRGTARMERLGPNIWSIFYRACLTMQAPYDPAPPIVIVRAEFTVLGPTGEVYSRADEPSLAGDQVGGVLNVCSDFYTDSDPSRAVAESYRLRVEFSQLGHRREVTASGQITSRVPTRPQVASVTLESTVPAGPAPEVTKGTSLTFTASSTGGVQPHEYRWRVNGFTLQDWSPARTITWDTATVNGRPLGSRRIYFGVQVRGAGGTDAETGATVEFDVADCQGADQYRPICLAQR